MYGRKWEERKYNFKKIFVCIRLLNLIHKNEQLIHLFISVFIFYRTIQKITHFLHICFQLNTNDVSLNLTRNKIQGGIPCRSSRTCLRHLSGFNSYKKSSLHIFLSCIFFCSYVSLKNLRASNAIFYFL